MKRLYLGVLFVFATTLAAEAATYWAAPSGNNVGACTSSVTDPGVYLTIRRAKLCATSPGDTINVKGNLGPYSGSTHTMSLLDDGNAGLASGTSESVRTTVRGVPTEPRPVLNIPNWFILQDSNPASRRSYITLKYLLIDGAGGTQTGTGDLQIEGDHIRLDDITVQHSWYMNVNAYRDAAQVDSQMNHLEIINSHLYNAATGGGSVAPAGAYCAYINADDILIDNNECAFAMGGGFQIYDSRAGHRSDRSIVRNNWIHDIIPGTGLNTTGGCFGIAVDGIDAQVYNNVITMPNTGTSICTSGGIITGYEALHNALIYNNTVYNWPNGIQINTNGTATAAVVRNNLATVINLYGGTWTNDHNIVGNTNVLACVISNIDFHLKAGSPCVNTGATIATVTTDKDGIPRPQGSAYDIGAYEFTTNTDTTPPNAPTNLRITRLIRPLSFVVGAF